MLTLLSRINTEIYIKSREFKFFVYERLGFWMLLVREALGKAFSGKSSRGA